MKRLANRNIKKTEKKKKKPGRKRIHPLKRGPKRKNPKLNNPKGIGGFAKGVSGNPQGRPKDPPEIKAIKEAYKEDLHKAANWASKLERPLSKKEKKLFNTEADKLSLLEIGTLKAYYLYSVTGDVENIKYITDHIIGKPKETLDVEGNGGNTIVYNIPGDYIPNFNGNSTNNKSK